MEVGAKAPVSRQIRLANMHESGPPRQRVQSAERGAHGAAAEEAAERVAGGVAERGKMSRIVVVSVDE